MMNKTIFGIIFLMTSLSCHISEAIAKINTISNCGDKKAKHNIELLPNAKPILTPPSGKAIVYFFRHQILIPIVDTQCKISINNDWRGGLLHNTYFYLILDLGEYDLCVRGENTQKQKISILESKTYFYGISAKNGFIYKGRFFANPISEEKAMKYLQDTVQAKMTLK